MTVLDVKNKKFIVVVAREMPCIVSFNEKQRFIGMAASASLTMAPKNTISKIKRFIGRKFSDPEVQQDLRVLPFKVTEGPDGCPLIHVQYLGEKKSFTPSQILGMILSNLKELAEKNLQTHVTDSVIGILVFFSEVQHRAMLDAAAITGLRPVRLIHEMTATALAYGIYKTDLPDIDPINVVFVDVGHVAMQICVAAFKKGQLKVLGHAFDRSLGGRDFDEVLFQHFYLKFKEEYKIDVLSNARACQRLRAACEKTKKVLSAKLEAPLNIECLIDEKDVKGFLKREDFEKLAQPILERVRVLCERALAEAKLSSNNLYAVEVVGSGSRVPAILKILTNCAMLSPTFRVHEFEVQDAFPLNVCLAWKGVAPECEEGETCCSIVFPKGNAIPSTKMLTFYRSGSFLLDVMYADTHDLPPGTSQKMSNFAIGPFKPTTTDKPKIKVKIRLNLHGIVSVESATMIEEEEVEVPLEKTEGDLSSMDIEGNQAVKVPYLNSPSMGAAKNGTTDPSAMDTVETNSNTKYADMESPKKIMSKKKKTKRTDVLVKESIFGVVAQAYLQKAIEQEYEMALQDRVMEETKAKKNAVKAYYANDTQREQLTARLQDIEDWFYDEGENETKGVYVAKLVELKKLGYPIEEWFKKLQSRAFHVYSVWHCTRDLHDAAYSNDSKFDHIDAADYEKFISECEKAKIWLEAKQEQKPTSPKATNPDFLCVEVKEKTETSDRFCKPMMVKPLLATPLEWSATPKDFEKIATEGVGQDNVGAVEPIEAENQNSEFAMERCHESDRLRLLRVMISSSCNF
ncbi:hypothetical protein KP509_09G085000 [Ceratopteris richardii]|uniref:Heat shock 70 kDa protein 14 n=1 Tax=Ceratopteris richardii TaxID=49495 RepID=A0A8T2U620_CERRI|nr:hypothetical protein KP509_09G085000 [Ceratopteris richardii]